MAREATAPNLAARRFFFVLLIGTLGVLAVIMARLGPALLLAAVLAVLLSPLQKRLSHRLRDRPNLSAAILLLGVVVCVLGPVVFLSAYAVKEATDGVKFVADSLRSDGVKGLVDRLPESISGLVERGIGLLPHDLGKAIEQQGGRAAAAIGSALAATGSLLFQCAMMLIALFFLLTQGYALLDWVDEVSPLRRGQTRELLAEFKKVADSVVVSTFVTSAIQAAVALVGYLIARVPNAIFFTAVTFFFAFIPTIGAGFVCIAAAGLLFLTGHPGMAIFLAIWGVAVVGLVDNLVKPMLMRGGVQLNGAIVFFALIGGIAAFGPVGLIIGPFAVALLMALLRMYQRDFSPRATPQA